MIENTKIPQDRLSAVLSRFALTVRVVPPDEADLFVVCACGGEPARMVMFPGGCDREYPIDETRIRFCACVDWGGQYNPLHAALPKVIDQVVSDKFQGLVDLLILEYDNARCGAASVLNRLGEVLVVCLLREQLANGTTEPGLIGGLSDARISRVIVAIHEMPNHPWRNAELAEIAGLSISRFAEVFVSSVGETPAAYLRKWRLTLARQDIERGDRVQTVAWRYCYRSSEALGRAFKRVFNETPTGRSGVKIF